MAIPLQAHAMALALTTGLGLGFLVAAQVGPVWLLTVRSVLRGRVAAGIAIGGAAALVDTAYAALGVAGAARLLEFGGLRVALGLIGAGVLVFIGSRTIWQGFRVRTGLESVEEVTDPKRAFLTGLAATASNPSTIISWAAIFAAASTADVADSGAAAGVLLAGIAVGSFTWFVILSSISGVIGSRIGDRAQGPIDVLSGLGLTCFGAYLGFATLRDR